MITIANWKFEDVATATRNSIRRALKAFNEGKLRDNFELELILNTHLIGCRIEHVVERKGFIGA